MNKFFPGLLKGVFLTVLCILLAIEGYSQSNRQLARKGKKLFNDEAYRSALPFYEQILAKDPDNASALFYAGVSYMAFDKEKAGDYLMRAQKLKPKVAKDIEYWLGRTEHLNYRFDEAVTHFRLYDATLKANDIRKAEIATLIQHSRNAKLQFSNPKDIFVNNLGPTVNTSHSEHSPVISADDNYLLFTSRAETVTGGKEDQYGEYFEDIFETRRTGTTGFEKPKPLTNINTKYHDAAIQLFDNGNKLLLYRDDRNGDFFVSTKDAAGNWSVPQPISGEINTAAYESDAYITPDNQRLYFATSFYSEAGDKDLYVSERQKNGNWGKPKSLGNAINSKDDDDSPYLTPDGNTMYFTSKGHNTMGGYDVFVTKYDSVARRWSRPENMGYPINSPDDDAYYRLSPDGSYAYLSSYRMGGYGEKDIWTINYIKDVLVRGKVYNLRDSTFIPGVEVVLSGQQANKTALSYRDVTKPTTGEYGVTILSGRKYQVTVTKDGRNIASEEFEVPVVTTDSSVIEKDFYVPFTETDLTNRYSFKKIYFDTDEYELRPESISELDNIANILKTNPIINISIDGHCDSRHSDEYNITLGDNRARAAYNYLVSKGISATRLITNSYGERRPAAPNDSPENMQLNRRSEFTIIPKAGEDPSTIRLNGTNP